jgi:hypothetical protein
MGKLFNLKEWLTVSDAAQHLSIVFSEEVTEADIYQLALGGKLTLSVDFPNGAYAKLGRKVPYDQAKLTELPIKKVDGTPIYTIIGEHLTETGEVIQFDDKVRPIYGVWDLCMMHNDRFDIEWRFYQEISNISRDGFSLEGLIVKRDNIYSNLQELLSKLGDEAFNKQSEMILSALDRHIRNACICESEAERMIAEHHEKRKKIRDDNKPHYMPASGLPSDSILVVRAEALREFEQSINGAPTGAEKPMTTSERNSLLTIIAALCDYSAIKHQERGVAGQIAKMTEEIGTPVTDETILKVLKKIPDALASRMK